MALLELAMIRTLWYFLLAIGFLILIVLLLFIMAYQAKAADYRYLKIESSFVFSYSDTLPYDAINPMCWTDSTGYCDTPLENVYRLYYVVDFDTQLYSVVMHSDAGCFVYTLRQDYGADNQPHLATLPEWIECP